MGAGKTGGYVNCLNAWVGVRVSRAMAGSGVFGAGESVDPRGCGVDDLTPSGGGGFQFCEAVSIKAI